MDTHISVAVAVAGGGAVAGAKPIAGGEQSASTS